MAPLTILTALLSSVPRQPCRLIACDMDGTLLNKQHALSERSLRVLRGLSERGVHVALCSGRSAPAIQDHATALALSRPLPVVAYNGALGLLARAPLWTKSASTLFITPVPSDAVSAVLRVAAANGLLVQYYVGDHIYVVCKSDEHVSLTRRYVELTSVDAHVHVSSYDEAIGLGPPFKLLVMGDAVDANLALLQAGLPGGLCKLIRGTPPFFVEVLHPDVHKGEGLRALSEALELPLERVVAFGDGDNDVEFVSVAGLGVAMSNARPPCRAAADRVTDADHAQDGVARALEEMERQGELATTAPRVVLGAAELVVRRVSSAKVLALRERVLWPGRPEMCVLSEDETASAVHLAACRSASTEANGEASGEVSGTDTEAEVVGVLSLFLPACLPDDEGGRAQFRKLAVDEGWRGRGIGSSLIDVAAAESRAAGAASLFCHARLAQAAFYEARGFARRGQPYAKYGSAAELYVEMELML